MKSRVEQSSSSHGKSRQYCRCQPTNIEPKFIAKELWYARSAVCGRYLQPSLIQHERAAMSLSFNFQPYIEKSPLPKKIKQELSGIFSSNLSRPYSRTRVSAAPLVISLPIECKEVQFNQANHNT